MMYNKIIEDCFFFPRHVGTINLDLPFTVHSNRGQQGQNVLVDLYLQCDTDKTINRACFKATGNPYLIAALEWLCRQIEGMNLDAAPPLNYQSLITVLEIPVPQYPIGIQVEGLYKEVLALMKEQFAR